MGRNNLVMSLATATLASETTVAAHARQDSMMAAGTALSETEKCTH